RRVHRYSHPLPAGARGTRQDQWPRHRRGPRQHNRHPAGRRRTDQSLGQHHYRHCGIAKPMTHGTLDPLTLTVGWNTLISIADELGVTLRNTAFSEGVREGDDFSTAIFNRDAIMIAQGNFSPGHLGSMPAVAKTILQYFPPETLKPGDSILVNDSF